MDERPAHEQPGEVLTEQDWTEGVEVEREGSMEAALANAMVGLKKRFYGKGPHKAHAYVHGNFVFGVLEGGVLRSEQSLLDAGYEDQVRTNRLAFQEAMTKPTTEAVEKLTGRRVLGYHSQIVFAPDVTVEFFVLDGPPER